ncbi:Glycosyl transferase, group 2 family [hydrothermal vent metagenome]|uniref:Glycosyl transferase, group 2 family n=1 Tax=hydrothermal vent metagenome TaxID=652676 RepID=A0A3B1CN05_9ZZZZ
MTTTPKFSLVAPVYNEVDNLDRFVEEAVPVMDKLEGGFEIVLVDDGSTDGSYEKLVALHNKDTRVKVVRLRGNFGQTAAFAAGFDYAKGDIILTIDADLQNDPADIPALVKKLEDEEYDIVAGWRYDRKDKFISRRLPSIVANKIISMTTNVHLHDYGCSLKAFRYDVVKNIKLYGEMHRFIPAIASWMGIRVAEMKVNHRPRVAGVSKYGIGRTVRVMLDLLTVKFLLTYSTRPIQIFGLMGFISGAFGFLLAFWLSVQRLFFDIPLSNRPVLLLAVLLILIGVQFISMGLLAEMQSRTYHESQNKPVYVIKDIAE